MGIGVGENGPQHARQGLLRGGAQGFLLRRLGLELRGDRRPIVELLGLSRPLQGGAERERGCSEGRLVSHRAPRLGDVMVIGEVQDPKRQGRKGPLPFDGRQRRLSLLGCGPEVADRAVERRFVEEKTGGDVARGKVDRAAASHEIGAPLPLLARGFIVA